MVTWIEMGDDVATDLARKAFLKGAGLQLNKTRDLHEYLLSRTGLHTTGDLARHFKVQRQAVLRRLRVLLIYELVIHVDGEGRKGSDTGGRESALWGANGETIEEFALKTIAPRTMGQHLAEGKPG